MLMIFKALSVWKEQVGNYFKLKAIFGKTEIRPSLAGPQWR
jgi:hypothetical protein